MFRKDVEIIFILKNISLYKKKKKEKRKQKQRVILLPGWERQNGSWKGWVDLKTRPQVFLDKILYSDHCKTLWP